jgi:hypothetical protein
MPEANMTTEYWIQAAIAPETDAGNPAAIDGDPVWSVVSGPGDISELDPPDPLKRWLGSLTPGDTTFLVQADADLGAGTVEVAETFLLHFTNPQAANLHGTLGEPVLRPTP